MGRPTQRDEFSPDTKLALAKRSGFLCAICRAFTVGPSKESPAAVTNVGVAAHISGASPGGPRYDASLSRAARVSITNGIWLCQTHAKLIDDDAVTWTTARLQATKAAHEESVAPEVGVPQRLHSHHVENRSPGIKVREYAFVRIGSLIEPYRAFIGPILNDRGLTDESELGILMCGTPVDERSKHGGEPDWTAFVNPEWLRWYLSGRAFGHAALEVPAEQVYGRVPAWPDTFFEFLAAIVQTGVTFFWQRHPQGYLTLCQ
jgi:hypothetical protein